MAKGYDRHQERLAALSSLGRELARRSRATCELCETSGVKLSVFEVPPAPEEPEVTRCIFICDTCKEQIENPKRMEANHWRCLNNAMWSEVPAAQVMAVIMLHRLAKSEDWATDLLDQLYLDEEVQAWVDEVT